MLATCSVYVLVSFLAFILYAMLSDFGQRLGYSLYAETVVGSEARYCEMSRVDRQLDIQFVYASFRGRVRDCVFQ